MWGALSAQRRRYPGVGGARSAPRCDGHSRAARSRSDGAPRGRSARRARRNSSNSANAPAHAVPRCTAHTGQLSWPANQCSTHDGAAASLSRPTRTARVLSTWGLFWDVATSLGIIVRAALPAFCSLQQATCRGLAALSSSLLRISAQPSQAPGTPLDSPRRATMSEAHITMQTLARAAPPAPGSTHGEHRYRLRCG